MGQILEMKNITKEFPGVKALNDVSFLLDRGSVHALVGENGAGKSTLMKVLFGIYSKDQGTIILDDKEVNFQSPRQALNNGVAMVHQELNQVSTRPVMENIWLGRFPKTSINTINHKKMYQLTKDIFDDLGIDVDPKARISTLSVSKRQMVEIAKAVSYDSKVFVFDEPTSSLTEAEVNQLFKIITTLKNKGCGIIYISHKLNEILKISDEVSIMRDGKMVTTLKAKDATNEIIIKHMVGRNLVNIYPPKTNKPKDVVLEVNDLTTTYLHLKNINFYAREGEILGFSGLNGAGRTELMESLFGLTALKSGQIKVKGKKIKVKSSVQSIKNGFAYVSEERRANGIFGVLNIKDNSTISKGKDYLKYGLYLDNPSMIKDTKSVINDLRVKTPGYKVKMQTLSGGNQQKCIFGRWLLTNPEIFLLDEPTRGIDVGAKYEIYQLMIDLANSGKTILIVSSEMQELLGICDRIIVMSNGQIAGEVIPKNTSQEEIITLAGKYV